MTEEIRTEIEELCRKEASGINKAYAVSEALGNAALVDATLSFEDFLTKTEGPFIRGMNVKYRHFVVQLLLSISQEYRGTATMKMLMT